MKFGPIITRQKRNSNTNISFLSKNPLIFYHIKPRDCQWAQAPCHDNYVTASEYVTLGQLANTEIFDFHHNCCIPLGQFVFEMNLI